MLYINFPQWLKPEVFGFLNLPEGHFLNFLRWYGMMYIVAIMLSFFQSRYLLKTEKFKTLNKHIIDDYYFWAAIGLVLGARIIFCLVYDFSYYIRNINEILIPFRNGQFVGFQGMSFHGGAVGVFIASLLFARLKKINFLELCDLIFPTIPLGYTFGRLANFINGELYGRITSSWIGMIFPSAEKVPLKYSGAQEIIGDLGWTVDTAAKTVANSSGELIKNALDTKFINNVETFFINLPRHPSQLYEALFEGIVLFFIVWFIARKLKLFRGFSAVVYLFGYSLFRFVIEFFRQPDSQFADVEKGKYIGYIFGSISMGQILSIIMMLVAVLAGIYLYKLDKTNKTSIKTKEIKNKQKKRQNKDRK